MDIKKLLPFLDDESLSLYLEKIKEGKIPTDDLVYALPFFNRQHIKEVCELVKNNAINFDFEKLLPFLDDEMIEEIYEKILNKEITNIDEETILPFLSEQKLKTLFKNYLNNL